MQTQQNALMQLSGHCCTSFEQRINFKDGRGVLQLESLAFHMRACALLHVQSRCNIAAVTVPSVQCYFMC